uniref:Uncharacterized protein n=1 Tax=Strigamia maritima TaxID=126957 RepID=T1ILM9_STRMM
MHKTMALLISFFQLIKIANSSAMPQELKTFTFQQGSQPVINVINGAIAQYPLVNKVQPLQG